MVIRQPPPVRPEYYAESLTMQIAERGQLGSEELELVRRALGARRVRLEVDGRQTIASTGGPIEGEPLPFEPVQLRRPLRFAGRTLGDLIVDLELPSSETVARMVDVLAATCATALAAGGSPQSSASLADSRLRGALDRIRGFLAERPDLNRTLRLLASTSMDLVDGDAAAIGLIDVESNEIMLRAPVGAKHDRLEAVLRALGPRYAAPVLRTLRPDSIAIDGDPLAAEYRGSLASLVLIPLRVHRRAIGAICVSSSRPNAFGPAEVEVLSTYANQGAIAIENSRLFATLQERLSELSALHDVSRAFVSLSDLDAALGTLVGRMGDLLDAERCVILLLDDEQHELVAIPPARGFADVELEKLRVPIRPDSPANRAWQTGEPFVANAAQEFSGSVAEYARALDDRSVLIAPLQVSGRPIGVVRISNKRSGAFTRGDARLLMMLAAQAAAVIENARLFAAVEHERELLRAIFEHTTDGIVVVDQDRRVVTFNHAMERLTGFPAAGVVGAHCHERYQCHDDAGQVLCWIACPLSRAMQDCEQIPYYETRLKTRDGGFRDVAVSYSFVPSPRDPSRRYGIAVARDISHLKEVERAKSQFISTVSHELRTPLASIQASLGVLQEHLPPDFPDPLRRLVANAERSGRRLITIVGDLLDLAQIQNGRVQLQLRRINLRDPIEAAMAMIRPLADDKRQTLQLIVSEGQHRASGDRGRIEQITLNLLSNAVKYSPAGTTITVRLEKSSHEVRVSVSDEGPGIPPGEREQVFERFYRRTAHETQRATGCGLGLPIARALVELHGGHIWVEGASGKGSTFVFTIPTRKALPMVAQGSSDA